VLTVGRRFAHHASKTTEFIFAQAALAASHRQLPNAFRWIPADDTETSGVAEQRLDVGLDAASITLERRCLDRPAVSAEEPASFSLFEIPIADVLYRHADPDPFPVGRWVSAVRYGGKLLAREVACILGRQYAVLS
jgi:hypothetical protein